MKSIEIQDIARHLKPLKIGEKTTPIELSMMVIKGDWRTIQITLRSLRVTDITWLYATW